MIWIRYHSWQRLWSPSFEILKTQMDMVLCSFLYVIPILSRVVWTQMSRGAFQCQLPLWFCDFVFFLGHLIVLLALLCLCLIRSSLFIHAGFLSGLISCSLGWSVLEFVEGDIWNESALLDPSFSQGGFPWYSCKQFSKQVEVHSTEVQSWNPAVRLDRSSQDPKHHNLKDTAANSQHAQPVLPCL